MVNILTLISPGDYASKIHIVLKDAQESSSKTVYVSLNKTYSSLIEQFKQANVDVNKIMFIDTISATVIDPRPVANCVFLTSAEDINALQEGIMKAAKEANADLMVFDSLSSLTTYKEYDEILKFITKLLAGLSLSGCSTLLTCLKSDEEAPLISQVRMKVDKTIDLS
jgi:archaellum biogenesis ATPase FlaH